MALVWEMSKAYPSIHTFEKKEFYAALLPPFAHEIPKPGPIVGSLPWHVLHVVIVAGLGDGPAGDGDGIFAALHVDVLCYLGRLLPRNIPAFFASNISTDLTWDLLECQIS